MKKHKLLILLPVVLALASLLVSVLFPMLRARTSAESHFTLGQRYLNEMDYSGAVLEFSNALALDPTDQQVRVHLAQAYEQTGNYGFAAEVLKDVLDEDRLDRELAEELVEVYTSAGNYGSAIGMVTQLIYQTDDSGYYEKRDELMRRQYTVPRSFAQGTGHALLARGGTTVSRGSNTLGQLGTQNGLSDRESEQTAYASAQFPGVARSVYCVGNTSYVIDQEGDLWAAGENRWGQLGLSYGSMLPESGWVRIVDTKDVAAVAGNTGSLFVLKYDGSLWQAGAGTGQRLEKCATFGPVVKIAARDEAVYVLTARGRLYGSSSGYYYGDEELHWETLGNHITDFTPAEQSAVWLTEDGTVASRYGLSCPDGWVPQEDGTVKPAVSLRALAANDRVCLALAQDRTLYQLELQTGDAPREVETDSPVSVIYTSAGCALAELEDGTVLRWGQGETIGTAVQ